MDKAELLKYREYHWNYFSLHADQRLKTFNFYIVVSAIFIGAFINVINNEEKIVFAFILPYFLSFFSFIFWKLDLRTKGMIKISENAIKLIDDKFIMNESKDIPNELHVFRYDDYIRKNKKEMKSKTKSKELSYSKCFNTIFFVIGVFGFLIGTFYLIDTLIFK